MYFLFLRSRTKQFLTFYKRFCHYCCSLLEEMCLTMKEEEEDMCMEDSYGYRYIENYALMLQLHLYQLIQSSRRRKEMMKVDVATKIQMIRSRFNLLSVKLRVKNTSYQLVFCVEYTITRNAAS
jgi:hypothetical protein